MSKELTPLKALNTLRNGLVDERVVCITRKTFDKCLDIIESALKEYEKQEEINYVLLSGRCNGKTANVRVLMKLKALEIIKEKKVNVLELSTCAYYETYLAFFNTWNWNGEYDKYMLTQEEYNLLKEALL